MPEIEEYPFYGTIIRPVAGEGKEDDSEFVLYEGVMDEHMTEAEIGRTLQTSQFVISIPLTTDANDEWIVPHKGDRIILTRYGDTIKYEVDYAQPSQIGGVSIYAARSTW